MFISQLDVNRALNDHFVTNGVPDIDYFNHLLQLALDNTRHLYEEIHETNFYPPTIAFDAFAEIAGEILHDEYGDFYGGFYDFIARWCDHFCGFNVIAKPTIDYIISERAEAQNEREADTMNTEINSTNITNDIEKEEGTMENIITCAECGCVIENENYAHEVDGDWYCDECFDEKYVICEECGEIIERDDAFWYEGEAYCEDCFDENFAICARCGDVHPYDEMTEIDNDWYCEDCRDDRFTQCERCGEWVRNYDIYSVHVDEDGSVESWCQDCFEYHTWTCEECEESWSDDVPDDNCVCPNCSGSSQETRDINEWRAPRGVRSYSYKPDPCLCYLEEEDEEREILYGFELEVDKAPYDADLNELANFVNDSSKYTYVKHDGSLDNGMEIVSHPATIGYHMSKKDTWEMIFNELLSSGLKSHDAKTCGLHVHIGIKQLDAQNPWAANNMLFLMDHFWDKFVKFSRRTEEQLNHWARRYSRFHGDYESWKKQAKDTRDRYYALNFQNRHTIEIRMFRGTMNLTTFLATLQFVDTLVKKCIEIKDLPTLQALTWDELVENDWPELNIYLKQRGLAGTPEEIARVEAEKEAKRREIEAAEERRRAAERAEREERERRAEERNEEMNRDFDAFRDRYLNHRVRIISAPDRFNELVGHEGTVVAVVRDSYLPFTVDFINELPVDFSDDSFHSLHGTDHDVDHRNTAVFWNCNIESVEIIDEQNA